MLIMVWDLKELVTTSAIMVDRVKVTTVTVLDW